MKEILVKGQMDNSDGTFESANRVYEKKMKKKKWKKKK